MSQPALSLLESGASKLPAGDTLMSICRVLRLNPEWLLFGRGEKYLDLSLLDRINSLSADDRAAIVSLIERLSSSDNSAEADRLRRAKK